MQTRQIETTDVFRRNYEAAAPTIVNIGGARSSKSFSLIQLLLMRFINEDNKIFLITRKTLPSLRMTSYKVFVDLLEDYGYYNQCEHNKSNLTIKYKNNIVYFLSIDSSEKIKCYHPSTEILTKDGFKYVSDLVVGEHIASYNPITKEADYYPIHKMHEYDYNGDMIRPQRNKRIPYVDFCVTPNHKMIGKPRKYHGNKYYLGSTEFIEADQISYGFTVPRTAAWGGKRINHYIIPKNDYNDGVGKNNKNGRKTTRFSITAWLKFLGWYLSEGSIVSNKTYEVAISQTKPDGRAVLRKDLNDFPYNVIESERDFRIAGKDLVTYLSKLGKSHDKYIPRDILELQPSLLKHLFNALMAGDGTQHKSGRFVYSSSSKQLIDDVCELSIKLGKAPIVWEVDTTKPNYYPNAKRHWCISISNQDEVAVKKKERIHYEGKVYCPEVWPHHTVLTRLNGRIMWCGQSTEFNYVFMEEANEFSLLDFRILSMRMSGPTTEDQPNRMYLSLNPSDEFSWINQKLIHQADVEIIHSTYKDNPFLSDQYVKIIEDLKDIDPTLYKIYGLGQWAQIANKIYSNYIIESKYPDAFDDEFYGVDFGYNVQTAVVHIGMKDGEAYVIEMLYQTKLTNEDLIEKLKTMNIKKYVSIYADSAEPARIEEICRAGFNCLPAIKKVDDGIDTVKRYRLHLREQDEFVLKEIRSYKWKEDKNGNVLDEPVKFNDHLMDSIRYALHTHFNVPDMVEAIPTSRGRSTDRLLM